MEWLQSSSLQPSRHLLRAQDCIYSICLLIRPDLSFYWSIINLDPQSEERKWLLRALLSYDPGDSACFIFGLHGKEIGGWRLNQFPCVGSLARALGWARLCGDALGEKDICNMPDSERVWNAYIRTVSQDSGQTWCLADTQHQTSAMLAICKHW